MPDSVAVEKHSYDVLVIGAGGSGLRAAIAAHEAGLRVAVICKSLFGKAHTVMAEGGCAASMGNANSNDNWQVHFRDTMRGGKFLNNWRMAELHGGSLDDLEIYPNVWAGVGLLRAGAGTALVGSYEEVAERIAEYVEAGVDEFILSGYPHVEEAYWFGEGVAPLLRERGLLPAEEGEHTAVAGDAGPGADPAPHRAPGEIAVAG